MAKITGLKLSSSSDQLDESPLLISHAVLTHTLTTENTATITQPLSNSIIVPSDIFGTEGDDTITGTFQGENIYALGGNDRINAGDGNDTIYGNAGDDTIDGGTGQNVAAYSADIAQYRIGHDESTTIVIGPDGHDTLKNISALQFGNAPAVSIADLVASGGTEELMHFYRNGDYWADLPTVYSGPVEYLQTQALGTAQGEVAIGTSKNDFINLFAGDDAINGGAGDDVLDGGLGSSFLTGGAGHDVFFVDGRSGGPIWSTITDWEANEQVALWGWIKGVSTATWVDSAGSEGWKGVTMHADLDGNGTIDASITWTGMTQDQLPTPTDLDGLRWFL